MGLIYPDTPFNLHRGEQPAQGIALRYRLTDAPAFSRYPSPGFPSERCSGRAPSCPLRNPLVESGPGVGALFRARNLQS